MHILSCPACLLSDTGHVAFQNLKGQIIAPANCHTPLVYWHWLWWSCTETRGLNVTPAVAYTSGIVARPIGAVCMMVFSPVDLQGPSRNTRLVCVK